MIEGANPIVDGLILDRLKDRNLIGKVYFMASIAMTTVGTLYGLCAGYFGWAFSILLMTCIYIMLISFIIIN